MQSAPDLGQNTLQSPAQSSSPELTTLNGYRTLGLSALPSASPHCCPPSGRWAAKQSFYLEMEMPPAHPDSTPAFSLLAATLTTPSPKGASSPS